MTWAFVAPEDTAADRLVMYGYEAACLWMKQQGGVGPVEQEQPPPPSATTRRGPAQ